MIPKIIHYCWFGNNKKSKLIKKCISTWKKHLPNYKFYEWNESNCDLTTPFVELAYNNKKWAFVSDFIRLEKLYTYGGIYLDTDMLLLKSLDEFLENECFFGAEDLEFINGAIFGTTVRNSFLKQCIEYYKMIDVQLAINWGEISIPKLITSTFRKNYNFNLPFNKIIEIENIVIYPNDYFYPLPYSKKNDVNNYKSYINKDTVAIHLWCSTWVEHSEFHYLRIGQYRKGLFKVFKVIFYEKKFEFSYLKKIASCFKESINTK